MNNEASAKKQIDVFLAILRSRGIKVSEPEKAQYCFESDIIDRSEKVKLRVYFGAKGVKTIVQGDKQSELYKLVDNVVFGERLFTGSEEEITEPEEYIGTDESGKGDYFGPLVIAGVLVNNQLIRELKAAGVRDSKTVPDSMIAGIAGEIRRIVNNKVSVVFISPVKYNELYSSFSNLNRLLAWGHSRVIENLLEKYNCETVISDKFGDENLIRSSLKEKGKMAVLLQYHKAERYTAVAAASIIARNEVNNWFVQQSKKSGLVLPKGASALVDAAAGELVKKSGREILSEVAKLHFKTTTKILG
jgi:ribonuclease HIII